MKFLAQTSDPRWGRFVYFADEAIPKSQAGKEVLAAAEQANDKKEMSRIMEHAAEAQARRDERKRHMKAITDETEK